ncbi:MAG: hypothetical protein HYU29_06720 [Chloroflexi bacterium]|nr:hypothetical protein [Chloroflexota bacterium]
MEFFVRVPLNKPSTVEVRYDCACGCKPRARFERGSSQAGFEHCCCGRVHFVGDEAVPQLEVYLRDRRTSGKDSRSYALSQYQVTAPWGPVPVAFGTPDQLNVH